MYENSVARFTPQEHDAAWDSNPIEGYEEYNPEDEYIPPDSQDIEEEEQFIQDSQRELDDEPWDERFPEGEI